MNAAAESVRSLTDADAVVRRKLAGGEVPLSALSPLERDAVSLLVAGDEAAISRGKNGIAYVRARKPNGLLRALTFNLFS